MPILKYSDFRLKKFVTGYSVILTAGSANRKFEEHLISDPIPLQEPTIMEPISTPTRFQDNKVSDGNHGFEVVAFSVRIVEFKNEIILKNIVAVNYGRVERP